jgi:hypothetical protein
MDFLNLFASSTNDAAAVAAGGMMFMVQMIFAIGLYLIMGFALMTIAKKLGEENGWWGFVPILNLLLMVKLAQKEMWWVILFFIPCVNIVIMVMCWMVIAERRGKPNWMGILMIVPCVNWIVPLYIAFSD